MPLRVDSYKTCEFGCKYCFANDRKIMEFKKDLMVADTDSIERRLDRVLGNGDYDKTNFLDKLIADRITWHFGGMSDPFQPVNESLRVTNRIIDIGNRYGVTMLISTKSDTTHGANIRPDLHSFQLSVSNIHNRKDIEPNVPDIERRLAFFHELQKEGFRVGIRIQPFIPGVSDLDIVKMFEGAQHFIVEGIKVIPQNGSGQKEYCFGELGLNPRLFTQMGLLNLLPEYRMQLYQPLIDYFEAKGISYSISDNDLRRYGNNRCCCGDRLIDKSPGFDVNAIIHDGDTWTLNTVLDRIGDYGSCVAKDLVTSNRTDGCTTVYDFARRKFKNESHPMSPHFQYSPYPTLF